MKNQPRPLLLPAFLLILLTMAGLASHAQLPDKFSDVVLPDSLPNATGLKFDPQGRMYVWTKSGKVYRYRNDSIVEPPLLDISEEVGNYSDMGLLGFALDPDFENNGFFYCGYTVDRHHLLYYGTPNYDPTANENFNATIGRVTRFQADAATDYTTLVPNSRKVLIGESASTGIPMLFFSHGMGSLEFGSDGTLLLSTGDGAAFKKFFLAGDSVEDYSAAALASGIIRPAENIGSYRAQLVDGLNGKILRFDPATGDGLPSNPFYDPSNPRRPASRVYALGLRNPFRFAVDHRQGSSNPADGNPGVIYVGDVGGGDWEEINVIRSPGQNFGWPHLEGHLPNLKEQGVLRPNPDAPNPLFGRAGCTQEYFYFSDLVQAASHAPGQRFPNPCDPSQDIPESIPTFPIINGAIIYNNKNWNQPTRSFSTQFDSTGQEIVVSIEDPASHITGKPFDGIASIGGVIYEGSTFPPEYQGDLFHCDYDGWIRHFDLDFQGNIQAVDSFHNEVGYICDLAFDPRSECLYYISFVPNRIHRVCYGGNPVPVAAAAADVNFGSSPLEVQFSSAGSYDPLGEPIQYAWDFGDGQSSISPNPLHTFVAPSDLPAHYTVKLTVTDTTQQSSTAQVLISLNNTPPRVDIVSLENGEVYEVGRELNLNLQAEVSDAEYPLDSLRYAWQVFLHHNTHFHPEPVETGREAMVHVTSVGCETEPYWYRIRLEVTDPGGLSGIDELEIYPWCFGSVYEMVDFEGIPRPGEVQLNWTTRYETKVLSYEIQRAGSDGVFRPIGKVDGQNGNFLNHYAWLDRDPLPFKTSYRLKITNADRVFSYSEPVQVPFLPEGEPLAYPNPFQDFLHVTIPIDGDLARFELLDLNGAAVMQEAWFGGGLVDESISMAGLRPGMYLYRIFDGSRTWHGRVVKVE